MTAQEVRALASALDAGAPIASITLTSPLVVDVVDVARLTGAPRSRLLRVVADSIDNSEAIQRDVAIASTSIRQSAMVLGLMPAVTSIGAGLFGFNSLGFLIGHPLGWVCGAMGAALSAIGWVWMGHIQRRVVAPPPQTGLIVDLVAEILSVAGIGAEAAVRLRDCVQRWSVDDEWIEVERLRSVARDSGASVVSVLRAHARECRLRARSDVRAAIEEVPGRLLVPLGVCLFPAFVVLTVVPAVAGMAQGFFRP